MQPYKDEPRDLECHDNNYRRNDAINAGKEAEYLARKTDQATAAKFA
jgi:hypothetical protein